MNSELPTSEELLTRLHVAVYALKLIQDELGHPRLLPEQRMSRIGGHARKAIELIGPLPGDQS